MIKPKTFGIDLGTSNCAISICNEEANSVQPITQLSGAGRINNENSFASALYIQNEKQFSNEEVSLPWSNATEPYILGNFAREIGAQSPDRLVTSAKSWLCTNVADSTSPILPWKSDSVKQKLSPLKASELYLRHLRHSYFHSTGTDTFEDCQVVLTVPASFDESARNMTYQAAINAGFDENIILLEEPLAAFYAWLDHVMDSWRDKVKPGDVILVCDIGGGTTDFSLIAVTDHGGNLELKRISVGKHILLGGDNMDLALAYTLRQQLENENNKIDDWQFLALIQSCRKGKEKLFSNDELSQITITIPSRGSSLFAKTISIVLTRSVLEQVVIDGFFQQTDINSVPETNKHLGLQEIGLPYASDAVISKHIAQFLAMSYKNISGDENLLQSVKDNIFDGEFIIPNAVLFNGGVFNAKSLRNKVLSLLNSWTNNNEINELIGPDLDIAVSRGAAVYGYNKIHNKGVRVKAGVSRSYYIGLESSMPAIPGFKPPIKALCVVQQGMEEGEEGILDDKEFFIRSGTYAEFKFFSSTQRGDDQVGHLVENAAVELEPAHNLSLEIKSLSDKEEQESIPVKLHSQLTELGTLQLWMQHTKSEKRWTLSFDIRD